MPSPPISPTPRRWRSPGTDEPHPDYAALLSSFDVTPETTQGEESGEVSWRRPMVPTPTEDERSSVFLSAPGSPLSQVPEIRTTSPSPQRPLYKLASSQSSDVVSSPLPSPPSRTQMFGDASNTAGRMVSTGFEGNRVTGPREAATSTCMSSSCFLTSPLTKSITEPIDDEPY